MTTASQPGILAPVPSLARYLFFSLIPDSDPAPALAELETLIDGDGSIIGIGDPLARALGVEIPGLRTFPALSGPGIEMAATPFSLWCWLRGDDHGELLHRSRTICRRIEDAFLPAHQIDGFRYGPGLDLTGYEDGTENPEDEAAIRAALARDAGSGLDHGSYVAVQQWHHDLDAFEALPETQRDHLIGRRRSDNQELEDAPASAHVKRTAQESFTPEAFILRRSMPWADATGEGLVFVSFGHSFDAFETLLRHMTGADDGISDALFRFTRPLTGSYFWCPPMRDGKLDLSALGA